MTLNQLHIAVNHSNRLGPIDAPPTEPDAEPEPGDTDVDVDVAENSPQPEPESEPEPETEPGGGVPEWAQPYTNPAAGIHGVGAEFVSLTPTEDGRWRLSGMFDADHGAVLDAALAEMFDRSQVPAVWAPGPSSPSP
ncbi:hypothetical protein BH24ACT5_BH24ACT5_18370 [soil metagenome]